MATSLQPAMPAMATIEADEQTGQTHAAQAPVQTEPGSPGYHAQPRADHAGWTETRAATGAAEADRQRQITWAQQDQLQRQTDWNEQQAQRNRQAARLTSLYEVHFLN